MNFYACSPKCALKPLVTVIIIFLFACMSQSLYGRQALLIDSDFVARVDSLHQMAIRIIEQTDNDSRLEANKQFKEALLVELKRDSTLQMDFSSARTVSFLTNPQRSFRIITWYVPFTDGTFRFFGFVQLAKTNEQNSNIIHLNDNTQNIARPAEISLNAELWFGAFYYELIHVTYRRSHQFLLLGWKGNNRHTRIRVIEPFHIDNGYPIFGKRIFFKNGESPFRIIFEHASRASMSLNFYPEFSTNRLRNVPAIIFDHLIPIQPDMQGDFRFYVPAVNIVDAFIFRKGRWEFVEDVDARVFINPALLPLNPPN